MLDFIKNLILQGIEIFRAVVMWLVAVVGSLGYFGIFFLMVLESSFIPFPSEAVIAPAGYLVHKGEMNLFAVVAVGTLGSIVGALINYFIAYKFGRPFLIKYGKYMFMNLDKLHKMESFFTKHGEITTFIGRLIPVVRQYISFPAGVAKMNLTKFIIFTALGASIWVAVLAVIGYSVGSNIDAIEESLALITYITIPTLILILGIYIFLKKRKADKLRKIKNEEIKERRANTNDA